ncbi:MAG TPA: carboxypeptidase regulatory-like domain-containing protein [Longimicrobium sp.]
MNVSRLRSAPLWLAGAALFVLAVLAAPAKAQERAAADTVAGRVIAAGNAPIAGATVRLTQQAGAREQAVLTDGGGWYRFVVPGGSGSYVVSATAFGYLPFTVAVERAPGATRIDRDLRLSPRALELDTLRSIVPRPGREKPTAAERAARWSSLSSEGFPVEPGSFADVAALEPGVVRVGAEGSDLSIAGQSPEQNGTTVDGATYGGGSLPSEGVRSVGVFTNSYDVARGQFSGGQIAATTISGTNLWGGSLSGYVDDPALRYGGAPEGLAGRNGRQVRLNGGGGGALVRDRLFVYGALDLSHGSATSTGLELLDSTALRRLGVAPDSVRRLVEIAQRVGAAAEEGPERSGSRAFASALARVDYTLSEHQSLTARLDWRGFDGSGFGSSPLRLGGDGADQRARDGGLLLQHTAGRGRWANELRAYASAGHTGAGADAHTPSGTVRVLSTLPDGTTGASMLGFGGTPFARREEHSLREVANELRIETGGHLVKAGLLIQEERATVGAASAPAGTFTFNSLGDLENGRPSAFTRNLARDPAEAMRRYAAAYVGDSWRPSERLGMVYGLRLEATRYGRRLAPAPAVDSVVGRGRGQLPAELVLTPRLGIRYDAPGRGAWTVVGGAGGFGGVAPLAALAPLWSQTGAGEASLVCIGPAAPVPDWERYGADSGAIPSACANGGSIFSSSAPRTTLFDPEFGAPRTWRLSLGASGKVSRRWGVGVDVLLVRGTHLPSATDRNLVGASAFVLQQEGGRPVYVAPNEIDLATGGIAPGGSRAIPALGPVLELGSRGESRTRQLTGTASALLPRGQLSLAYTMTHSRTLAGGIPAPGAAAASTAGDPTHMEWTDASFAPRHLFQGVLSTRLTRRLRLSAVGRLASGLPFTPLVSGDVNGDGYGNDRAFIFDPAFTDDLEVAAAIERLADDAPHGVRRCLREQAGRIAEAGSCRTPWSPSLDLRAELLARGNVNTRRATLTLTATNVTAGLDYLLHGPERLRGWGQYSFPDANLLEVRGFDRERRAFDYGVNPNFGRPSGGGALRLPFRVALQARITLGADPRYQPLMQAIELGSGRARESIRSDLARRIRNVPAILLSLSAADPAALGLTPTQRARLRALADSLAPSIASAVDSLTSVYTEKGPFTALRRARRQEATARAGGLSTAVIERTREQLTAEQWARVPAWLARPPSTEELNSPPKIEMSIPMGGP